jgi:hypothetical protein
MIRSDLLLSRPFGEVRPANNRTQELSVHPEGKRIAFSQGGVLEEIWNEEFRVTGQASVEIALLARLPPEMRQLGTSAGEDLRRDDIQKLDTARDIAENSFQVRHHGAGNLVNEELSFGPQY